ncbi:MAG TPA: hypothetical protein VF545_11935 [Thermoleophilaceae bacterium]|jgi:hypothetical protein
MADAAPSEPKLSVGETWRRLNFEQRVAAVGAVLLIVSTLGPFSFVEAAIVLVGLAVLLLLRKRAEGREFHVPFGDGAVIAAAGGWAGLLIVVRLFSRPLGQGLLALVCAAILILAGLRERAKRPMDDLPAERVPDEPLPRQPGAAEPAPDRSAYRDETLPLRDVPTPAKVLPPRAEERQAPPPRAEERQPPPLGDDLD